jgi:hypothetical protein
MCVEVIMSRVCRINIGRAEVRTVEIIMRYGERGFQFVTNRKLPFDQPVRYQPRRSSLAKWILN